MTSMRRVRLAVLFLIAAALSAGTPALAAGGIKLVPTGVEPGASGQAWWGKARLVYLGAQGIQYAAPVRVTCQGLTPRAVYYVHCSTPWSVPVGQPFVASDKGTGVAEGTVWYWGRSSHAIDVRNAGGIIVLAE